MPADSLIAVALSGGVDSATAAAMLVAEGHRVIGLTMRLYNAEGTITAPGRCCGPRDIEDARSVCAQLDIPFYVVDHEDEFKKHVIDDFVDSYLEGQTPNPCVRCNETIKFTPLLKQARMLGADKLATGHYARLKKSTDTHWDLHRGVCNEKDQSYFLFAMPQHFLDDILFPLGDFTKEEVRQKALFYNLPNATKQDSQEICFVPDGNYASFVEQEALTRKIKRPQAGVIEDVNGNACGMHQGIHHYTVGQRKRLGAVDGKPAYVVRIDSKENKIIVGDQKDASRDVLYLRDLHWFSPVTDSIRVQVQIRHRQSPRAAHITLENSQVKIVFDDAVIASSGQAAVFYDDDRVMGGGWIV